VLNIESSQGMLLGENDLHILTMLSEHISIAMNRTRLYSEVQQLAVTDPLTNVYNRRGLYDLGQREVERAVRFGRSLAALMIDIDHFKHVNDRFKHATGDQVLRALAERLVQNVRDLDIVGRYGGEEFVILLPENDRAGAYQIAERLRQVIEGTSFYSDQGNLAITVSIGVTQVTEGVLHLDTLLLKADEALYFAKQNGRNCVVAI
jgi:diguanylate cyclase (GGDEF)-like protein